MSKFTLTKEFRFEAAHRLPHHEGKCQRLHGHSWRMRLILQGEKLHELGSQTGMLEDFGNVSKAAKPLVEDHLDHYYLNDTTGLTDPTSEALAAWTYEQLKPSIPLLVAVEIDETCTSSCRFEP